MGSTINNYYVCVWVYVCVCVYVWQGWTPLQLAVSRGCWEMALCLLLHGSPPLPLHPTPPSLAPSATGLEPRDKTRLQSFLTTSPPSSTTTRSEGQGVTSSVAGPGSRVTAASKGWRDWHRQRFLQAVLETSFLTPGSLQGLADLGLLTSDLLEVVHRRLTFPGPAEADSRDAEPGDSASSLPDWENATPDPRSREEAEREGGREKEVTTALVVAAVQSSLRLQHQCRLALRHHLSVGLLTALPRSGLPRPVQNYVTLGKTGPVFSVYFVRTTSRWVRQGQDRSSLCTSREIRVIVLFS